MTRRIASAAIASIPLLTFLVLTPRAASSNGAPTRLLRIPTVSANAIAFAYANNIWTVERSGGTARRLTSFQGESSNPHFSPDGKFIAFSAEYAGNVDVYVVPADGGEPKRLTWHPGNDFVQGWTPDGTAIMFSSSRASWAPSGAPRFWTVPAEGGVEQPMALPRGYQGKISADGTFRFRKLGTLVGKRTCGGLVHTADTPTFIDGGSMIAPRGGFFSKDGKWAVENEGVAPDIDVEN